MFDMGHAPNLKGVMVRWKGYYLISSCQSEMLFAGLPTKWSQMHNQSLSASVSKRHQCLCNVLYARSNEETEPLPRIDDLFI